MRNICRNIVLISVKKFSGNPADLPIQLRLARAEPVPLGVVGPVEFMVMMLSVTFSEP